MIGYVKRLVTGCKSMNGHFGEVICLAVSVLAFVHCPRIPRSYPYFCKYGADDGRRADKYLQRNLHITNIQFNFAKHITYLLLTLLLRLYKKYIRVDEREGI